MDENDAIMCLVNHTNRKPSEIGAAVDTLHHRLHSYDAISERLNTEFSVNLSPGFLNSRHRLFKLPKGIRWKIDEGKIGITQAASITRLEREPDQWLLAVAVVERNISSSDCENVANLVVRRTLSIKEALSRVVGVRFDEISPPALLLPMPVDFWYALSQSAWDKGMDWQDLCYQLIRQGLDIDLVETAAHLEEIAISLRKATGEVTAEAITSPLTTATPDPVGEVKAETDKSVPPTDPPAMLL